VSGLYLKVSGSWSYETSVSPDRIVLRLEAKQPSGEFTQIAATDYSNGLTESHSETFNLTGNLLDTNLTATEFSLDSTGDSVSRDIDVRLTLEVSHDGDTIDTHTVEDSATITVTKEQATVESSIDADGTITVV
jgi:plastocyanin domain-containing protein